MIATLSVDLDAWHYIVECRWRTKLADIRELDGLYGQIARSGKQTMGLYVSIRKCIADDQAETWAVRAARLARSHVLKLRGGLHLRQQGPATLNCFEIPVFSPAAWRATAALSPFDPRSAA